MQTSKGHLTYCSNIHSGESWNEHFQKLKENIPVIKQSVCPLEPFGIGLRLSNAASLELRKEENLLDFLRWLGENDCYVFTMNGFPYGGFHNTVVKDQVHAPDWRSADRVNYTIRMAQILAALLPEGVDGGISTSPLSYKFWHKEEDLPYIFQECTLNLLHVLEQLVQIHRTTGKIIHIDIEPEPDGLLGDGKEFMQWYMQYLVPIGTTFIQEKFGHNEDEAAYLLREHIQICYDVCHFAVSYEDHGHMIAQLRSLGIKTGKIQISAALKATLAEANRSQVVDAFRNFNEPVYLHQVIAKREGGFTHYRDLADALNVSESPEESEWRAHYHVPIFIQNYGALQSTQEDIVKVLNIQAESFFTFHLEIETYTWEVLPPEMRLPIAESIIREIEWVFKVLNHQHTPSPKSYA
jgi:hypothetical protein